MERLLLHVQPFVWLGLIKFNRIVIVAHNFHTSAVAEYVRSMELHSNTRETKIGESNFFKNFVLPNVEIQPKYMSRIVCKQ